MNAIAQQTLSKARATVVAGTPQKTPPHKTSRDADKFVIRLPDDIRPRLKAAAKDSERSMNGLIVHALREFLDGQDQQRLLLESLGLAIAAVNARKQPIAESDV